MLLSRLEELHAASKERLETLRSIHSLRIFVMREHDRSEMTKMHPGVKEFLRSFRAPEPLSPLQALFGGSTSAFRLRYTAGPNETVRYINVTFLYPYVDYSFPYPLGHPTIIYRDFDEPQKYFGLIRAVIYPPRKLYFPILPHKTSRSKLVFTLYRT